MWNYANRCSISSARFQASALQHSAMGQYASLDKIRSRWSYLLLNSRRGVTVTVALAASYSSTVDHPLAKYSTSKGDISQLDWIRAEYPENTMARVHRVTLTATILAVAYFLTFFNFLSVPLLDSGIAEKLLPVVRIRWIPKCVVPSDYSFTS